MIRRSERSCRREHFTSAPSRPCAPRSRTWRRRLRSHRQVPWRGVRCVRMRMGTSSAPSAGGERHPRLAQVSSLAIRSGPFASSTPFVAAHAAPRAAVNRRAERLACIEIFRRVAPPTARRSWQLSGAHGMPHVHPARGACIPCQPRMRPKWASTEPPHARRDSDRAAAVAR